MASPLDLKSDCEVEASSFQKLYRTSSEQHTMVIKISKLLALFCLIITQYQLIWTTMSSFWLFNGDDAIYKLHSLIPVFIHSSSLYFVAQYHYQWGFPGGSVLKTIRLQCRRREFNSWVGKIPWRREWLCTQVFLPGKSLGQRSLAGYSPLGCKSQIELSN